MIIIADDQIPFLKGIPEQFATVNYLPVKEFNHNNIKDADILMIRTPNKCTRELLSGSRVKFIASTTSGFDHIDINYCQENNIDWINCPGCNAVSVGQYILASLIELAKKEKFVLKRKTIGIVGVGNVGKQVERICKAYGMDCLLCDPPRELLEGPGQFVNLQTVAETCDIISFHVPLIREGDHSTYHLADKVFFNSLKRKPYFINAARGAVHDTEALLNAEKEGLIKGMIIDCWENEPAISEDLLKRTLIATPHIAGFSADGKANGTRMCLQAIASKYNIIIDDLDVRIQPDTPKHFIIDLNEFPEDRIENAVLRTFSPLAEDMRLRKEPDRFEYLRTHYNNPREFPAYIVVNASEEEIQVLKGLGFKTM